MSLRASGSIQVVTKDAKLSLREEEHTRSFFYRRLAMPTGESASNTPSILPQGYHHVPAKPPTHLGVESRDRTSAISWYATGAGQPYCESLSSRIESRGHVGKIGAHHPPDARTNTYCIGHRNQQTGFQTSIALQVHAAYSYRGSGSACARMDYK